MMREMSRLLIALLLASGTSMSGQSREQRSLLAGDAARRATAPAAGGPVLPAGTPLPVELAGHMPMRVGEIVHARLLYPVYSGDDLVLEKGTAVNGSVIALAPDKTRRNEARLRADFTPFRKPVLRFDQLTLPDGRSIAITTSIAADGAPIYRLTPPPPARGGMVRQQVAMLRQMAKDRLAVVTGPDKRDRLTQFLYTQLPYHPQRIEKGTAWTVETAAAITLPSDSGTPSSGDAPATSIDAVTSDAASSEGTRILQAYLKEPLSSQTSHQGEAIRAVVCEPIRNADQTIAVPVGSVLTGAVTQARPARRFGRAGVLRIDFRQMSMPDGSETRNVQTNLQGIDAAGGQNLTLDSEGKVKPKPQDKIVVPLLLLALASRPLDEDHGDGGLGKDAVASNSLGLAGFLVGTAGGWRNVAAGMGYYGTAVALYNRWIKKGSETTFPRDTRIVLQTTIRRSTPLASLPQE